MERGAFCKCFQEGLLSVYVGAEMKWQFAVCLMVAAPQEQPDKEAC